MRYSLLLMLSFSLFFNCTPVFGLSSVEDNIIISNSQIPLESRLKEKFNGLKFTITNLNEKPVQLIKAEIQDAYSGGVALQDVDLGYGIGTTWMIAGPVGLYTLGLGWVVGIIATPIVYHKGKKEVKKTRSEAKLFSNKFTATVLQPGESISTNALLRSWDEPKVQIILKEENKEKFVNFIK